MHSTGCLVHTSSMAACFRRRVGGRELQRWTASLKDDPLQSASLIVQPVARGAESMGGVGAEAEAAEMMGMEAEEAVGSDSKVDLEAVDTAAAAAAAKEAAGWAAVAEGAAAQVAEKDGPGAQTGPGRHLQQNLRDHSIRPRHCLQAWRHQRQPPYRLRSQLLMLTQREPALIV